MTQADYAHGFAIVQVALTPAAVGANTVVEQIFQVPYLPIPANFLASAFLDVNKPTQQAGLGLAGARVLDDNRIAIWFANTTAGAITPTGGETYTCLIAW